MYGFPVFQIGIFLLTKLVLSSVVAVILCEPIVWTVLEFKCNTAQPDLNCAQLGPRHAKKTVKVGHVVV